MNQCNKTEAILSTKSVPLTSKDSRNIKNSHLKIRIGKDGKLREINNFKNEIKSNLSERFSAYKFSGTR